jgi:hypothetical protein
MIVQWQMHTITYLAMLTEVNHNVKYGTQL